VMSSTRIKPTVPFSLGIPTLQYQNLSDFFGRKERQGTFTYQPPSTRHLAEGLLEYLFQRRPDRLVPIYEGGTVPILGYGYHSKLLGTFHSQGGWDGYSFCILSVFSVFHKSCSYQQISRGLFSY
jgi:hypothetical protein